MKQLGLVVVAAVMMSLAGLSAIGHTWSGYKPECCQKHESCCPSSSCCSGGSHGQCALHRHQV